MESFKSYKVKKIFPDVIILRLAFFLENELVRVHGIKADGTIRSPGDPEKRNPWVCVVDAGKAAAGPWNLNILKKNAYALGTPCVIGLIVVFLHRFLTIFLASASL